VRARVFRHPAKQFYKEGDTVREVHVVRHRSRTFEVALAQAKGQFAQAKAQADQTRRRKRDCSPAGGRACGERKEYDDATSSRQLAEASLQQGTAAVPASRAQPVVHRGECAGSRASPAAPRIRSATLITTDANGSLLTTINQLTPIWVASAWPIGPREDPRRSRRT